MLQAVAREDKGILGKDWNKSPKAYFRTSSTAPTVSPGSSGARGAAIVPQKKASASVFLLAGIVIGSLLVLLIVFGGLWNLCNMSRKKKSDDTRSDDSESDTDSMDLDLQNTDLESRIGGSRSVSRVSKSRSSRRRSPMSERTTGRTLSPHSSIQEIDTRSWDFEGGGHRISKY